MSTALANNGLGNKEVGDLLLKVTINYFFISFAYIILYDYFWHKLQVQDELKTLRTKLGQQSDGEIDLKALQLSIKKTESELKQKTDSILNSLNNQVSIIPEEREVEAVLYGASLGNLWESSRQKANKNGSTGDSESSGADNVQESNKTGNLLALRAANVKDLGVSPDQVMITEDIKPIGMKAIGMGPTPGQQVMQISSLVTNIYVSKI